MKLLVILLSLFSFQSRLSWSCELTGSSEVPNIKQQKRDAKAIFTGEVLSSQMNDEHSMQTLKIKLIRSFKGKKSKNIKILTGLGGDDCGLGDRLKVGEKYLIYAYAAENGDLIVTAHSRTRALKLAQSDIKQLGR